MRKINTTIWALLSVMIVLFSSCVSEEPEGDYSYYLDIQSQVPLNLHESQDNNQGTMPDNGKEDVLSKTVLKMKQAVKDVTSGDNTRQAKDAAVIRVCDSIYSAYVRAYGKMERIIVCHVKLNRMNSVDGVQRSTRSLKSYEFWLIDVETEPTETEKIEKPECLEQVDLGLSVNWANCNLGAKAVEGFGGHYAWGDPTGKLWAGNGIGYNAQTQTYSWNTQNYGGNEPPMNISGSALDVVAANWGDGWRMPTYSEAKELCEQCQWVLRNRNEIKWYEVIGPNGNSIIMPLAGNYGDDLSDRFHAGPYHTNVMGYYWTSTICPTPAPPEARGYGINSTVKTAWMFYCNSNLGDLSGENMFIDQLRAMHFSIRAVHDK